MLLSNTHYAERFRNVLFRLFLFPHWLNGMKARCIRKFAACTATLAFDKKQEEPMQKRKCKEEKENFLSFHVVFYIYFYLLCNASSPSRFIIISFKCCEQWLRFCYRTSRLLLYLRFIRRCIKRVQWSFISCDIEFLQEISNLNIWKMF